MTTGKWLEPGVPHKGWRCVHIADMEDVNQTCQMCEVQPIRYVHFMEHDDYLAVLECGCVCAGNMEQDREGAKERETTFKARQARRKHWLIRRWHETYRGGEYIKTDGFHISVWPKGDGTYGAKVECRYTGEKRYSRRRYETMEAAKLAAFDVMIHTIERWNAQ
jgi:hypothetical protein